MCKYLDRISIFWPLLPVLLTTDGQKCSDIQVHSPWLQFWHYFCKVLDGSIRLLVDCFQVFFFLLDRELSEIALILPNNRKRVACHLRSLAPFEPEKHGHSYARWVGFLGKVAGGSFWRARREVQQFHFTWSHHGSKLLLLPSSTLFKKKMGSNNGKHGLQQEWAVETHLQLKNI